MRTASMPPSISTGTSIDICSTPMMGSSAPMSSASTMFPASLPFVTVIT